MMAMSDPELAGILRNMDGRISNLEGQVQGIDARLLGREEGQRELGRRIDRIFYALIGLGGAVIGILGGGLIMAERLVEVGRIAGLMMAERLVEVGRIAGLMVESLGADAEQFFRKVRVGVVVITEDKVSLKQVRLYQLCNDMI